MEEKHYEALKSVILEKDEALARLGEVEMNLAKFSRNLSSLLKKDMMCALEDFVLVELG